MQPGRPQRRFCCPVIYALIGSLGPNGTSLSFVVTIIAGVLFSMAYLRTHALWLGWGMHFAWAAATAVVFGLPVARSGELLQHRADRHQRPAVADRRSLRAGRRAVYGDCLLSWRWRSCIARRGITRGTTRIPRSCPAAIRWMFRRPPAHTAMEQAAAANARAAGADCAGAEQQRLGTAVVSRVGAPAVDRVL